MNRLDESSQLITDPEINPQTHQFRHEMKDFDELADAVTPLWRVSLSNNLIVIKSDGNDFFQTLS